MSKILVVIMFGLPCFAMDLEKFVGDYQEVSCEYREGEDDGYNKLVWQVRNPDANTLIVSYIDYRYSPDPVERFAFERIDQGKKKTKEKSETGCSKTENESKSLKNGVELKEKTRNYLFCGPIVTMTHKDHVKLTSTKNEGEILISYRGDSWLDADCLYKIKE